MVAGAGQIAVDEILLQKGECYGMLRLKTRFRRLFIIDETSRNSVGEERIGNLI